VQGQIRFPEAHSTFLTDSDVLAILAIMSIILCLLPNTHVSDPAHILFVWAVDNEEQLWSHNSEIG